MPSAANSEVAGKKDKKLSHIKKSQSTNAMKSEASSKQAERKSGPSGDPILNAANKAFVSFMSNIESSFDDLKKKSRKVNRRFFYSGI